MRLHPRSRRELSICQAMLLAAVGVSGGLSSSVIDSEMVLPQEALPRHREEQLCGTFRRALLAAERYRLEYGVLPKRAEDLCGVFDEDMKLIFSTSPRDPWGNTLQIWQTGDRACPLIVFSLGADGRCGGLEKDADIDSTQVLGGKLQKFHGNLRPWLFHD